MKRRGWFGRSAGLLFIVIFVVISPLLAWPRAAQAHSAQGGAIYVTPTGRDNGHCDNVSRPCQTIRYAIDHAPRKNIEVRVAAGQYLFEPDETLLLFSTFIMVRGGFTPADGFSVQDANRYQTVLVGPSSRHRERLRSQGFVLQQDIDGVADIPLPEAQPPASAARINCVGGMAGIYPCKGIDLLAHIPLAQFGGQNSEASNIWGFVDLNDNHEYALIGLNRGTGVVDVTNPENPRQVGVVAATNDSSWRELKIYQFFNQQQSRWNAYAYIVSDVVGSPGIQIVDLTALPNSVSLATTFTDIARQHTIYLSNTDYSTGVPISGTTPYLYVNGGSRNRGAFQAFSVANPTALTAASTPPTSAQYTHDGTSMLITDSRTAACAAGHNPCEI